MRILLCCKHDVLTQDRTHRERKENYIRDLENEICTLKKNYQDHVQQVREENKKLKALLAAQSNPRSPQNAYNSPVSMMGTNSVYGTPSGFASPTSTNMSGMAIPTSSPSFQHQLPTPGTLQTPRNIHGLDYDEIGIDFVAQYGRTAYLSPPPHH